MNNNMESEQLTKIKKHFSSDIVDYDTADEYVVPKNEELHDTIVELIPFEEDKGIVVLDLGVGTGNGALKILKYPNSFITGIDFCPKMLSRAKEKLKRFGNRVELIEADFTKIPFPRKYDVIISAVTIHNETDEAKRRLFKKIYNSLFDGGIFINGDFFRPEAQHLYEKFNKFYESYMRRYLSGEELERWLVHAFEEDLPAKLTDQFEWLKEAGFRELGVVWQYYNLAVYYAVK